MTGTAATSVPVLGSGWRERAWARLGGPWDLVVVGGGITGAGIARRAAHSGLRVLLLEQRDFGWGTSSRSSKLVHGGLRYLAHGQVGVVRTSVRERERLLRTAPGLVDELGFVMPTYRGGKPGRWMYAAGLTAYDLLAGRRTHRHLTVADLAGLAPRLRDEGLTGGYRYADARTDDARLTLRVTLEAAAAGAVVLSYARVEDLLRDGSGDVTGIVARDVAAGPDGPTAEVRATAVVSATGAWADELRGRVGARPRIRPLRGSHLLFPAWRVPVAQAIGISHPADGRPVFVFPWESATLVGTTDVDHPADLSLEPRISAGEVAYLMESLAAVFPSLDVRPEEAVASFAGVRPVIGTGRADPSAESRDHVVWSEHGLLTVTGGKLTTFDAIARDALGALRGRFAGHAIGAASPASTASKVPLAADPPVDAVPVPSVGAEASDTLRSLDAVAVRRLAGRYGWTAGTMLATASAAELEPIAPLADRWAEVRWAARAEGVVHLEDLLLRRVRIGLRLAGGGEAQLERVGEIVRPELGWDAARWRAESAAYRELWAASYAPPGHAPVAGIAPPGEAPPGEAPARAETRR